MISNQFTEWTVKAGIYGHTPLSHHTHTQAPFNIRRRKNIVRISEYKKYLELYDLNV
ncbi:hypothetical protein BD770DRAFT_392946, partial [Pilaira anomala]